MTAYFSAEAAAFLRRFQFIPPEDEKLSSSEDSPVPIPAAVPIDALSLMDLAVHANTHFVLLEECLATASLPGYSSAASPSAAHGQDSLDAFQNAFFSFSWDLGRCVLGPALFACLRCYVSPAFDAADISRDVRALLEEGRMPYLLEKEDEDASSSNGDDGEWEGEDGTGTPLSSEEAQRESRDSPSPGDPQDVYPNTSSGPEVSRRNNAEEAMFSLGNAHRETARATFLRKKRRSGPPLSHVGPLLLAITTALWDASCELRKVPTSLGLRHIPWLTSHRFQTTPSLLKGCTLVRHSSPGTTKLRGGSQAGLVISHRQHTSPHHQSGTPGMPASPAALTSQRVARARAMLRDPFSVAPASPPRSTTRAQKRSRDEEVSCTSPPLKGSTLARLPGELMQHTLEYVTPCFAGPVLATVCKAWQHLVKERSVLLRFYAEAMRRVTRAYTHFFQEVWGQTALRVDSLTTYHRATACQEVQHAICTHVRLRQAVQQHLTQAKGSRTGPLQGAHPPATRHEEAVRRYRQCVERLQYQSSLAGSRMLFEKISRISPVLAFEFVLRAFWPSSSPERCCQDVSFRFFSTECKDLECFASRTDPNGGRMAEAIYAAAQARLLRRALAVWQDDALLAGTIALCRDYPKVRKMGLFSSSPLLLPKFQ